MNFTGVVTGVERDFNTNAWKLQFTVYEGVGALTEIDKFKSTDKLSIEVKKYREKRSLDANAYAWCLMQKIAEAVGSDKWDVYLRCLQRYSRAFTHVIVKENAVEKMKELYRTCIDLGEVTVKGKTGHQLQVYYGSSTFDSKEMSVFIEGIVSECKEMGIETMTPDELERMKQEWAYEINNP